MTDNLDIYGGQDPRDVAAYTIPMVSRYLRIPAPTLANWVKGYSSPRGRKPGLVHPPESAPRGRTTFLSFTNLVELHVLGSIRKIHEVPLPKVRTALAFIAKEFETPHPLAREAFRTNGIDLFLEKFGKLYRFTGRDRVDVREDFEERLTRVEYARGHALRLFPAIRTSTAERISTQPRVVVIDPRVAFGKPVVKETGVPVSELHERFLAGDSMGHLAADFGIPLGDVEEALRAAAA